MIPGFDHAAYERARERGHLYYYYQTPSGKIVRQQTRPATPEELLQFPQPPLNMERLNQVRQRLDEIVQEIGENYIYVPLEEGRIARVPTRPLTPEEEQLLEELAGLVTCRRPFNAEEWRQVQEHAEEIGRTRP